MDDLDGGGSPPISPLSPRRPRFSRHRSTGPGVPGEADERSPLLRASRSHIRIQSGAASPKRPISLSRNQSYSGMLPSQISHSICHGHGYETNTFMQQGVIEALDIIVANLPGEHDSSMLSPTVIALWQSLRAHTSLMTESGMISSQVRTGFTMLSPIPIASRLFEAVKVSWVVYGSSWTVSKGGS